MIRKIIHACTCLSCGSNYRLNRTNAKKIRRHIFSQLIYYHSNKIFRPGTKIRRTCNLFGKLMINVTTLNQQRTFPQLILHTMYKYKEKINGFTIPGIYVIVSLLALTAIVGSLFIYLGPKATEKSPGVLHVGIRFSNENTLGFSRYGKEGPGARIEFINTDEIIDYSVENLSLGRNLVPIKNLIDGQYAVRLSADGFRTIELKMIAQGRMLNPPENAQLEPGTYADYNMIGVRFEAIETASSIKR